MTNVRDTSIEAYHNLGSTLGGQQSNIYEYLKARGIPLTRSEISTRTGIRINAVCGRVNELIKMGLIFEDGKRCCDSTGRTAYQLRVTNGRSQDAVAVEG